MSRLWGNEKNKILIILKTTREKLLPTPTCKYLIRFPRGGDIIDGVPSPVYAYLFRCSRKCNESLTIFRQFSIWYSRVPRITNFLKAQRIKWFGQVKRRSDTEHLKVAVEWKPAGKGPRGRPKKRWIDGIMQGLSIPN